MEETLFIRGLTSPAGHTAWTGLTAGALWAFIATPGGKRLVQFLLTFAGAVVLHTCWDTFTNLWVYVILGLISLGWLFIELARYRTFSEHMLGGRRGRPLTV